MKLKIDIDATNARNFIIQLEGDISDRTALNDALGRRLARELVEHFRAKNAKPNRLGGARTNFWGDIAEATSLGQVTSEGADVNVADSRFRIHLFGGVIKPTGGRKFLTIPLIREAHGLRVREYERTTGRKLFKPRNSNVLMERTDEGTSSFSGGSGTVRTRGGFRSVNIRSASTVRPVYFLARQSKIHADPRALPPTDQLIGALMETGEDWINRQAGKGGAS